jgi:hypothetical protein
MARPLLKEKPKAPETRRVTFAAPAAAVARMEDLVRQADAAGFDLDLDAALGEAYAGLAKKLARELKAADVAVDAPGMAGEANDTAPSDGAAVTRPSQLGSAA